MPVDKPSFLNGIDDENTIEDALNSTEDLEKVVEEKPQEDTIGDDKPEESKKEEITTDEPKKDEPKKEEPTTEEPKKEEPKIEEPKKEEPKTEAKKETDGQVYFGKYKSLEEAEKGYHELQGAFTRATQTIEAYRTGKMINEKGELPELAKIINTPMIPVKAPKALDYISQDGTVDLDRFMSDYSRELVLSIQKSFLGGPLAAVQFDILKNALLEEHNESINESNRDRETASMTNKLMEQFPILKENQQLEEIVSNAITGAKMNRASKLKAEGKDYIDFTYDEYVQIISSILGARPDSNIRTKEDPTEKVRPQSTMTTSTTPTSEMDDIISGMEKVTDRSKLF